MRKLIFPLVAVAAALFAAGCTGPKQKRGLCLSNTFEVFRWGELRSSIELNAVEPIPGTGYFGFLHGFDRSLQRTGIGLLEVITFPVPTPTYKPLFPKFYDPRISPGVPILPESYAPGLYSDALFDTDTYPGFSGGDVAPWMHSSCCAIFDN